MAALQGIKRRIRSVTNTGQITRAQQLVAASKLRHAQEAATGPQLYNAAARQLLAHLGASPDVARHPFYAQRSRSRGLVIVVAADRGMAGAYNANIMKALVAHVSQEKVPQRAICIGRYAASHVAKASDVDELAAYLMDTKEAGMGLAKPVLTEALEQFLSHEVDAVHLISTQFRSTVKQEVATVQLLPLVATEGETLVSELDPNADEILDVAVRKLLEVQITQAILDARASEQAARMLAMMNATDNAKDLVEDLTLAYNNARQAAITQELADISAGTEAAID